MKVRKAKRSFEPKPKLQPKRNDLNSQQMAILSRVSKAPESLIEKFEVMIGELGVEGLEKSENGLWHPHKVAYLMGISSNSVEMYMYYYLRVIRRTDETAIAFRTRKNNLVSEECPFDYNMPEGSPIYRWLSSRVFLFICAAMTGTRGYNDNSVNMRIIREKVSDELGIPLGEKRKIPRHETQVHTFKVKDQ